MKKLFLAVATFFITTLYAHIIPQPCSIALEAKWLYWIAYGNLSSFAERTNTFSSQPDTTSTDFNNIFNYRSAFRIIGSCSLNSCNFLQARFTYFNSDHTPRSNA